MICRRSRTGAGIGLVALLVSAVGIPATTQASPGGGLPAVKGYIPNTFTGISAASPSDAWVVGNTYDDHWSALIKHWDGSAWARTPGPHAPGGTDLYLNAVAAIGPDDAWTVGDLLNDGSNLIAHWDGTSWMTVHSPQPGLFSSLNAITAVSPDDVWAAGAYWLPKIAAERPLLLHWDGQSWLRVPDDSRGVGFSAQAYGVTATGPSDAWLVGVTQEHRYSPPQTFMEHWDGTAWHRVHSPNVGYASNELESVSASSSTDVWSVGSFDDGGTTKPLALHWDGHRWHRVLMEHRRQSAVYMHSVSAALPDQVWAVGQKLYQGGNGYRALAEHWDGGHWQTFRSENPPGFEQTVLRSVSFTSSGDGWAAGNYSGNRGDNVPLIERWDGTRWNRVD